MISSGVKRQINYYVAELSGMASQAQRLRRSGSGNLLRGCSRVRSWRRLVVGDDKRRPGRASLLLCLPPRVIHLLGLDDDETLDLGEHSEERRRGTVLDGAVTAAEAHGLERAAVEAPRPREPPHQRDVQPRAPRHRYPRLERVERAPAHLRALFRRTPFARSRGGGWGADGPWRRSEGEEGQISPWRRSQGGDVDG